LIEERPSWDLQRRFSRCSSSVVQARSMAGMGRSQSTGALVSAGAAMSHVPKRATQHSCFLASWEVLPTQLKPGQHSVEKHVFSEESRREPLTYLQEELPPSSVYQKTISQLTAPKDYKNPVQPIRQKEPPAEGQGHRGAGHWTSTSRSTHTQAAVVGATYHRQHGPSYQAANPPTCIGGGGPQSQYQEDYGVHGSDPRNRVDKTSANMPVMKTALTAGTAKGTLHMPGYNGFLPLNTRNPYCARVESGATLRTNDKTNLTQQFHVNTLNYSGHTPIDVTNDFGAVNPAGGSMMSKSFQAPRLGAFK